MQNDTLKRYINNRHCDILGLGVSNLPLASLLCEVGITLTVRDKKSLSELGAAAEELARRGVRFVTGEGCFDAPEGELIFRSPGIRPDLPGLTRATETGAELTSEIELFLQLTEAQTFAVTGSDGKTTSTTLTGKFLEAEANRSGQGKVFVGGNIGAPLLDRMGQIGAQDRAVMELSSFQLMTVRKAPHYAAITNVSPNHMDWHRGSMEEYVRAKRNIVGAQTLRLVTNAECATTASLARELMAERQCKGSDLPAVYLFSSKRTSFEELFPMGAGTNDRAIYERDGVIVLSDGSTEIPLLALSHIHVPGRHNVENFMTAIALTYGQVDPSVYPQVADGFFGVEHRLERIRTLGGVDYYNSSIDSSPSRTAAALSALNGRDIVIICGGYDKKVSFEPLAESLCRHVRAVVLTGATGDAIGKVLRTHPRYTPGKPEIVSEPEFSEAVAAARRLARSGGCVLLSPACASFDAFRNFAERGNTFRKIVESFEN
ncbi:MAG: UDP-N-acetylmuramoyl-L-alanine--D-glutamate ligase [Clostridia bacterium]|nr:UDP-N-acetylmuramoyl-L-alanine--D-glutamate ligase [Clostridia bacterium]